MTELPDQIHQEIQLLSLEGDSYADEEKYVDAIGFYQKAILLLPDPKSDWDAWTWLQTAIGDSYFLADNWKEAFSAFMQAMKGPGGFGNPFIQLRLGQSAMHLGEDDNAVNYLLKAYMSEGEDIFEDEIEYLEFLKSRVKL